jgi:hypothetical protein
LEKSPVYTVSECSPLKIFREGDEDVTYLRAAGNIGPRDSGWVEGRAIQNFFEFQNYADFVGAPNAILTLSSPSGDRANVTTDSTGGYRLNGVPPGKYTLSARSPVLGDATISDPKVEVPAGGCLMANIEFATRASIAGQVVDVNGKPAPGVQLSLGELLPTGELRKLLFYSCTTDKRGRFAIHRVPIGRIVVAANLMGVPTKEMPFDPYYVPGTHAVEGAQVFSVKPDDAVTGLALRLPKPLPFGSLYVDVVWTNGTPARNGARAFAEANGARADVERAPMGSNRVTLKLALDRTYDVRVDWTDKHGKGWVEGKDTKTLDFTRDGQVVELRLKSPQPQ